MTLKKMVIAAVVLLAVAVAASPAWANGHGRGGRYRAGVVVGPHAVVGAVVAPRVVAVRPVVPVKAYRPFYGPYYAFRPRFSIGFGFFVGQPVPYPYAYVYPYSYPYPYSYRYPYPYPYPYRYPYAYPPPPYGYSSTPPGYIGMAPGPTTYGPPGQSVNGQRSPAYGASGSATYGGVSFEITPANAGAYVDGTYAGAVRDYSPTTAPLTLEPGSHHIEVRSPGCRIMSFDVKVTAGEVIPYRGTMEPLRR
jgi:hypothetical protein